MARATDLPWESHITFKACSDFMESVSREEDRKRRVSKLNRFLTECRKVLRDYGRKSTPFDPDDIDSLYPVMRLFLPAIDRERGSYGIKETVLAKVYVDLLKLGPSSADALKLKNYRAPKNSSTSSRGDAGDFGAVLFSVIKDRCSTSDAKSMSVAEINSELDLLVSASAGEGRKGVERILMGFFRKMSSVQQKWLVRIILKDVKMGLGQKTLMDGLHPDANDLYDVNANLEKVCKSLRDPSVRRHEIEVKLFDPFKPMLADRCAIRDVVKQLGNKDFYVDVKYDGERMQLHMDETGQFRFYSRNCFDFSDDFGRSVNDYGKFSYYVAGCLAKDVKSIILDGEICAYNHLTDSLTQKGEQMNIRKLGSDDPMYQQCLYVYDIVYLNGQVLTNLPLKERLEKLSKCVLEKRGRVQLGERKIGKTTQDVVDALNEAIDRREEGLVLKDPDSIYKPNVRTKGGWIKVKPEYTGSLMDQFDLIVMGGYYGSGRRGGTITHFLLGLAVTNGDGSTELPREFRSFCRVGSGYSYWELFDLMQQLDRHFVKNKRGLTSVSDNGFRLEFGREKPDVWITPKKSVILQVNAAEIVASDVYKVGCTLRFPRVEKIRTEADKPWHACMSLQEMEGLKKATDGKLANRHLILDDEDDGPLHSRKKRRKRNDDGGGQTSRTKVAAVSSLYRSAVNDSNIMIETHKLKDRIIVVEPCDATMKKRLEEIVVKNGGKCEQNVCKGRTFCFVETGYKIKAKNVARSGHYDVVRKEWLLDCENEFRPFYPSDMLMVASEETKTRFARDFDAFGDAYCTKSSMESMKFSMKKVAEKGEEAVADNKSMAEFESTYFDRPYLYGLFRQLRFYIAKAADSEEGFDQLEVTALMVRFHGGVVLNELSNEVTHVLSGQGTNLERLKLLRRKRPKKFHIVTDEWVEACIERIEIVPERDYQP